MSPRVFRWTVPLGGSTRSDIDLTEKKAGGFREAADENDGPWLGQERYFVDRIVEIAELGIW